MYFITSELSRETTPLSDSPHDSDKRRETGTFHIFLTQTGFTRNGARYVVFLFAVSVFHYDRSVVSRVSTYNFDLRVKLEYDAKCLLI